MVINVYYEIAKVKIAYEVKGEGWPVFLLHGWQMRKETFNSLARDLANDFKVYQIDLPGFGESITEAALTIEEYAEIIHQFIVNLEKLPPILVGHSFGGRISIKYASRFPVNKLVLIGTPGIKKPLNFLKKAKQFLYRKWKIGQGSQDYQKANGLLRKTLVMAVNDDLSENLHLIKCPTLLLWGEKDQEVKVSIAKQMQQKIVQSELVVIPKCGHFPYLERYRYFLIVLRYYLQKEHIC